MKPVLAFCFCFAAHLALGQGGAVMHFNDEHFAYKVKQIDEFIERFNHTDKTLIRQYLKDRYEIDASREELVISLFDFSKRNWNKEDIAQFLQDVVYPNEPPYISFYDKEWYALVSCKAAYQGKPVSFDLILSVEQNSQRNAVKWVVKSIKADFLNANGDAHSALSLPPNSHGTDFLELMRIFSAPRQYIDKLPDKEGPFLMHLLLKEMVEEKLRFKQVETISYHFLQLDHWIMKVEEFERPNNNAGWLISELIAADAQTKKDYKKEHLSITE